MQPLIRLFLTVLLAHLLGDFPLQSSSMVRAKHQGIRAYIEHGAIHLLVLVLCVAVGTVSGGDGNIGSVSVNGRADSYGKVDRKISGVERTICGITSSSALSSVLGWLFSAGWSLPSFGTEQCL
jgi:uncharacterized protein DUF3307